MSQTLVRVTPQDFAPPAMIDRMRSRCLVVGLVFAVLALVGAILHWQIFLRAWLFSFMFWLGLTTGSLALLCLQYTSGGNWGRLGRRIWEAGAGNWWLMALFWIAVFFGFSITFASIDWTMSLYPEWWSTVWGMLFMVGQVLTTFCFTIWLLTRLAAVEPISRMFKVDYLHDFGKLMFAFVVLWAYLSFSQWLIIWSGNMLSEIRWYLMRLYHGWQYFG